MIYVSTEQAYFGYTVRLHICTDSHTLISLGQIEALTSINVQKDDIVEIARLPGLVLQGTPPFRIVDVTGRVSQEVIETIKP